MGWVWWYPHTASYSIAKKDHTQCSVSDGWRKKTVGRTRLWTPWSISWQSWPVGRVWSTLLCISSGRIPSCGAGYHQWDHFCIHPRLLIRGSWIFKYLSSLICLTISILSLGLFCGFSLLHICSVIHASSSDVTDFEMIPAIPDSPKGWVFSLPGCQLSLALSDSKDEWVVEQPAECHSGNLLLHFVNSY